MPLFDDLVREPAEKKDELQKALLARIEGKTGRPVIAYLCTSKGDGGLMNQEDKSALVNTIIGLQRGNGIDVIIHSPGGFAEAAEMLAHILHTEFDHVRFIVPHSAKSAATMLCLSANELLLYPSSELGPTDPQISGSISGPAQSIIDGFEKIKKSVDSEKRLNGAFIPLLNKMDVATIQRCENAILYGKMLVKEWLGKYMFKGEANAEKKAEEIADYFSSHNIHLTHGKPIKLPDLQKLGIKVRNILTDFPDIPGLADDIWEFYCRYELIFWNSPILCKIIMSKDRMIARHAASLQLQFGGPFPPMPPLPPMPPIPPPPTLPPSPSN